MTKSKIQKISLIISIVFIFQLFISVVVPVANLPIKNKVSADGYVPGRDCDWDWPNWFPGQQCYLRGIFHQHFVGSYTNRIQYSNGHQYFFTYGNRAFDNREVVALVEWTEIGTTSYFRIINIEPASNYNQAPYRPDNNQPASGTYWSGNCDESTIPTSGQCRTTRSVGVRVTGVGDPDPLDTINTRFYYTQTTNSSTNNFTADLGGTGTITNTRNFTDGNYSWRVRSQDNHGAWGLYSSSWTFAWDSTPPSVPVLNALPQWTAGVGIDASVQVEPSIQTASTDNVSNTLSYLIQYSTLSDFSDPAQIYEKPWQTALNFEIGPKGADGIEGTADDLQQEIIYYFRSKAKDRDPGTTQANISNWSNIVSTTIDSTAPEISSEAVTNSRISPNNATSIGDYDSTNFTFQYTESHPSLASIEVRDAVGTLVNTLNQDISANEGISTPVSMDFSWDGKNSVGEWLSDGPYTLRPVVIDKAGNITNGQEIIVIVDNNEANISVSTPMNNFWTNQSSIDIQGQVMSPNDPGEEDQDLLSFTILDNQISTVVNPVLDGSYIFSQNFSLNLGSNSYELTTIDTVQNKNSLEWFVHRDTTQPNVTSVLPQGLINQRRPQITFSVEDPDPTGDGSQRSDIALGTNPTNMKVWLEFQTWNEGTTAYDNNTLNLIDNGVNLQPSLISNLSCSPGIGGVPSTKNNLASANLVECNIQFISDLQPDSTYQINVQTSDNAGNVAESLSNEFILDSHNYSEIYSPINSGIYSNSQILYSGKTVKGNSLTISNSTLGETRSFVVDENLNNSGVDGDLSFIVSDFTVACGEFLDIDSRSETPDEEVCYWDVMVKNANSPLDQDVLNNSIISLKDQAQNEISHNLSFVVNLYSFDLNINSDLQYFSPNGDGNQDNIIFSHSASNPTDPMNQPNIQNYSVIITDSLGNVVRILSGSDYLPNESLWDGKDSLGEWVVDGEYRYSILVETMDGIILETAQQAVFAKTALTDEVVITNPVDGAVTTDGVIEVQGQAPKSTNVDILDGSLRGEIRVRICVDTLMTPNDVACDVEEEVVADENGFFSTLIVLPTVLSQTQTLHNITAQATDEFGNQTPLSNLVQVIHDTIDPFNYVNITPALTGVSSEADYQRFLNGEISINEIRSVIITANVTQNTEQLQLEFAEYQNVNVKDGSSFNYIGTFNDQTESDNNLNPFADQEVKHNYNLPLGDPNIPVANCNSASGCNWKYVYGVPNTFGGVYEVKFKAKKGSNIQEMTAGFKADGSIPSVPIILSVEKDNSGSWLKLNETEGKFYTNSYLLRLRGAADPNLNLNIFDGSTLIGQIVVGNSGVWESTIDLAPFVNNGKLDFDFNVQIDDPINPVAGMNSAVVVYDAEQPELTAIQRVTPEKNEIGWVKTGDIASLSIDASESLKYADIKKEDGFLRLMTRLSSMTNQGIENWAGSINIDRKEEGFYNPQVRLLDNAGNANTYAALDWESYGLGDFRFYIDNTKPFSTDLIKQDWSTKRSEGGVNADGVNPELGRNNPGYVTKNSFVKLKGLAEKDQRLEILVNGKEFTTIAITSDSCMRLLPDKITDDGLLTRSGEVCSWSYDLIFKDDGANTVFGEPIHGYFVQVRVLDKAGNYSDLTYPMTIYHDTQAPATGNLVAQTSQSYGIAGLPR